MDVLVVECVLHVAVQVTYVRVGLDGEFLLDVLCPDEFTPLLPTRKQPKKKEKGSRVEPHGARTRGDPFLYIVCMLHCAVQVRLGNVQRSLHNLIETVVGHVPGDEQLRRRHMIQLSSTRKTEGEKGQNKRYYHQSNSIALLQLTDLCAHQ